jgi:hypothetical protein
MWKWMIWLIQSIQLWSDLHTSEHHFFWSLSQWSAFIRLNRRASWESLSSCALRRDKKTSFLLCTKSRWRQRQSINKELETKDQMQIELITVESYWLTKRMNCYLCLLNLNEKFISLYKKFFILKISSIRSSMISSMNSSIEVYLRPRSSFSRRFNFLIQSSSCSVIFDSIMSWVLDSSIIFVRSCLRCLISRSAS